MPRLDQEDVPAGHQTMGQPRQSTAEEQNQNHSRNSPCSRALGRSAPDRSPGDAINPLEYGKLGLDHSISAALEHGEITEKSRVHKCILSDRDPYNSAATVYCTVPG